MAKAINCNEQCSNFDDCTQEGVVDRFMPGSTCNDFFPVEDEAEVE